MKGYTKKEINDRKGDSIPLVKPESRKARGKMKITPLFDNILVKVDDVDEISEGGIYIPKSTRDEEQEMQNLGIVVAVGPGRPKEEDGLKRPYIPMVLKEGDRVYFGKYAGTDVILDGKEFYLMSEQSVLGVITEDDDENTN